MASVYEKFIGLCADIPLMSKDGANPYFRSKYTTLDEIMKGLKPLIAKHKVAITHEVSSEVLFDAEGKIVTTTILVDEGNGDKRQKRAVEVPAMLVSVTPIAVDVNGETIKGATMTAICPQNIQQIGSTVTYLKRYSISAFLGISADEDDDGNAQAFSGATPVKVSAQQVEKVSKKAKASITAEQKALIKAFKEELFGADYGACMDLISAVLLKHIANLDMTEKEAAKVIAEMQKLACVEDPRTITAATDPEDIMRIRKGQIASMSNTTAPAIWGHVKASGIPELETAFLAKAKEIGINGEWE